MTANNTNLGETKASFLTELRRIFWPIDGHENKKFIPMALMMACILFNFALLRSIKDSFVVTAIGAEAISFVKMYAVLPSAVLMMVIYAKLCNIMSQQKVFYTVTLFFVGYIGLFAFLFYPNPDLYHINKDTIEALSLEYPNFKWFIRIAGQWTFASFYVIAELWGSMMLSLLFWQFANQITTTMEAKRFYSTFGLVGNTGLLLCSVVLGHYLGEEAAGVKGEQFTPVFVISMISGVLILFLYFWVNQNVLTDSRLYNPANIKAKKSKVKLSLADSFKMILSSKYLGLIALLIIAYGVSINLVEGVWKAKIRELYPTAEGYAVFMGQFQKWQGIAAIIFMIIGSNILRRVSWKIAAMFTPVMILITGIAFFTFIFFDNILAGHLAAFISAGPLALAVMVGMVQNVLSKATKYSLFDSTKEMTYIPLDDEMKSKGKAAVDVIGGRFGKSGGAVIQSTFFMLLPAFSFTEAMPYFASIFFVIVILWIFVIKALDKEYNKKLAEQA